MSGAKKAPQECPCGFFNDSRRECTCTQQQIVRYLAKMSGPLLDRIDLQVEVPALTSDEITSTEPGEASSAIRERVEAARQIQRERFRRSHIQSNAEMSPRQLRRCCELDTSSRRLLSNAIDRLSLSARVRSFDPDSRILLVAITHAAKTEWDSGSIPINSTTLSTGRVRVTTKVEKLTKGVGICEIRTLLC